MSVENPSEELQLLTEFVMGVYIPIWFRIKCNPCVTSGASHLCETLKLTKLQPIQVQNIVLPVMQRNAYFGHPENILLCMICDERAFVRELGWRRIKNFRSAHRSLASTSVRTFKIPKLEYDCNDYINLIQWQTVSVSEPPIIALNVSDSELDDFIETKKLYQIFNYPLHTQSVERAIKVVSEASSQVCGHDSGEGFIHARLGSRERIPKFESKKDYLM